MQKVVLVLSFAFTLFWGVAALRWFLEGSLGSPDPSIATAYPEK